MQGPPPDPRQILLAPDLAAWAFTALVALALALVAWRLANGSPGAARAHVSRFLALLAATVVLTAPAAGMLPRAWWGSFPTIDKAGSLHYFREGVQWRVLDPGDPGVQLIGAHVGHLWPTSLLALVMPEHAAFGAQHLLHLAFAWFAAALLLEELCGDRRVAVLCAASFALNLHQLRDVNWYTVEKTLVAWVPLHAWALLRAHRSTDGAARHWPLAAGAIFLGACLTNLYVAWLCAGVTVLVVAMLRSRGTLLAAGATVLAGLPVAALQLALLRGPGAVGTPEQFLLQRAALDVVEVWPPRWNRIEAWAALDPATVLLAMVGVGVGFMGRGGSRPPVTPPRVGALVAIGGTFLALSLGPFLDHPGGVPNPAYRALGVIPGAWRIAKPETFFHVTWLCACALAALALVRVGAGRGRLALVGAAMLAGWVMLARAHPVAPPWAAPHAVGGAVDAAGMSRP